MARTATNVEMTTAKLSKDTVAGIRELQAMAYDHPTIAQVIARLVYEELARKKSIIGDQ